MRPSYAMKIKPAGILPLIGLILTTTPVWWGLTGVEHLSPVERSLVLLVLERREKRIGQEFPEPPKGPALTSYMAKRAALRDLINRIQNGEPVSPDEIDQQLWPARQ